MLKSTDMQPINTTIPRETLVTEIDDNLVLKQPTQPQYKDVWLEKQYKSKKITDLLNSFHNPHYCIPKIIKISNAEVSVIEEKIHGFPLTDNFVSTLPQEDIEIIYESLAHFINDINQSHTVRTSGDDFNNPINGIPFDEIIANIEQRYNEIDVVKIRAINNWFTMVSKKYNSSVFSHKDMNCHNVFYDQNTKKVSIIDFAEAGYQDIYQMFYRDWARLDWLDIDKLVNKYKSLYRTQNIVIHNDSFIYDIKQILFNIRSICISLLKTTKPVVQDLLKAKLTLELKKSEELFISINIQNKVFQQHEK